MCKRRLGRCNIALLQRPGRHEWVQGDRICRFSAVSALTGGYFAIQKTASQGTGSTGSDRLGRAVLLLGEDHRGLDQAHEHRAGAQRAAGQFRMRLRA